MNTAGMFEAFVNTNLYLSRKAVVNGIDRCTNHSGKTRVDQQLTAYDDEDTRFLRVSCRAFMNSIKLASFHSSI